MTPQAYVRALALTGLVAGQCVHAGAAGAAGTTGAAETPAVYRGVFALTGQAPNAEATLRVGFTSPTSASLVFTETSAGGGRALTDFDVDMTKRMHVIVISADFRSFEHLHPTESADGSFALPLRVPAQGRYEIYADTVPHGLGQQVFRFSVPFGSAPKATRRLAPTPRTVEAGPYAVTLGSLKLSAGKTTLLSVKVAKHGAPATDLHPYLGGAAHAVFINAATLSYTHVHPSQGATRMRGCDMQMQGCDMHMDDVPELVDGAKLDPNMTLHVVAPSPGVYKLWLQFRGGGQLYVAPFVLTAS